MPFPNSLHLMSFFAMLPWATSYHCYLGFQDQNVKNIRDTNELDQSTLLNSFNPKVLNWQILIRKFTFSLRCYLDFLPVCLHLCYDEASGL